MTSPILLKCREATSQNVPGGGSKFWGGKILCLPPPELYRHSPDLCLFTSTILKTSYAFHILLYNPICWGGPELCLRTCASSVVVPGLSFAERENGSKRWSVVFVFVALSPLRYVASMKSSFFPFRFSVLVFLFLFFRLLLILLS